MRGEGLLSLPPALFPALRAEHERQAYAARYWAMVDRGYLGESSFGVKSTYVGPESRKPGKPDYAYDHTGQQQHLKFLRDLGGLGGEPETPEDQLAVDRTAWQALRQQRRIRA